MEIVVFTSREVATAPANGHESSLVDLLSTMRGELFNELGLILPDVRLEVNAGLPQDHFSIRLNGDDLPALRGLSAREFLTNDTVDRLTLLGIRGRQDVNPATGLECAIVEETDGEWFTCRQAGLTTWGTRGHISLVLSAAIRAAADRFQSDAVTQACLDAVADSFPELVRMALERYPLGDISSVLRYLLREGIAIRDLRSILEALLTLDGTTDVDLRRFIVFSANTDGLCPAGSGLAAADLKPAQLADFVRAEGLKRPLSHKYTRGFDTLTAYLLDPTIETRLAESGREPLTNEERTRLLAAVHTKVDALPNRNPFAVILTTFDIRRALRRVIEPDLPRLGVLCYQELTPTTNIQPLGRIAWS